MNFGKMIKDRRLELGLTLEQVGERCGVGKSTVRKWETGMIQNMGRDKLSLLARALQMSPADLIDSGPEETHTTLTVEEMKLLAAYRAASDRARVIAFETLTSFPREKEETP